MSRPGSQVDSLEPLTRRRPQGWWDAGPNEPVPDNGLGPIASKRSVAAQPIVEEELPFVAAPERANQTQRNVADNAPSTEPSVGKPADEVKPEVTESWLVRRGHALTYIGIFLFTLVLYFRPYELLPGLEAFSSMALILAAATLAIYFPAQFSLEGNLTAKPVEIKLVFALTILAIISIPMGISAANSWATFTEIYIKAVLMFVVIINVARTEGRLNGLLWLALGVGIMVSLIAFGDFRSGARAVDGYRVEGTGRGMFGNPNDMALHLVMMTPIAIALLLRTRAISKKILFGSIAMLLIVGNVLTYSRGGFLGLAVAMCVLAWKLGKGRRLQVMLGAGLFGIFFMIVAPGNYGLRIASIFFPSLDPVGSSKVREGHLIQSILVTLRNPLAGIGMGNFNLVSNHGQVTHNAFTQVSSEIGVAALVVYVAFMVYPLWQLFKIETETRGVKSSSKYYYLAVGLQAGIAGYMVTSFFASVAYQWYIYYLIGYAVCLRRIYRTRPEAEAEPARPALAPGAVPEFSTNLPRTVT
ncbi:MAG: O-antigen ligase family protein [Pyrinomonadaceae bacterium]